MSDPALSVLLPVRNGGPRLAEALDSLRLQTFRDFEIVAVDDGSTDGTSALLAATTREEPRLRVLTLPATGLVAALNAGLAEARGEYVARLDADDLCHPDRLRLQKELLDADPSLAVASCLVRYEGEGEGYRLHAEWTNTLLAHGDMALNRFVEAPLPHPTACFRREAVVRLGGYRDGDFPEDYELWLRLFEAGARFAKVPEELVVWRDSPGRLSRTCPRYSPEAFYRVKAVYLAAWLGRHSPYHPRVVVVGAGRVARLRAECLTRHGVVITAYVDIDPDKIGRRYAGRPVIARGDMPPPGECFVLSYVASRGARAEIEAFLLEAGYRPGRDFLVAA